MKVISNPDVNLLAKESNEAIKLLLFDRSQEYYSCGAAIKEKINREGLKPASKAWDFMTIALSVLAADKVIKRDLSPDGWTRQITLKIAVSETKFWNTQKKNIEQMLKFLTTDIWVIEFSDGGYVHELLKPQKTIEGDSIALLSGGMDSLIGLINLHNVGKKPVVVSQIVRGDKTMQNKIVRCIDNSLVHFQLNHNINCTGENSTRSRSIIFLAYGILLGSCLEKYNGKNVVTLYVCENGVISMNVPLTNIRVGSLSTRTTHPIYLDLLQKIIDNAKLMIKIVNPYQFKTKGEMCLECKDQGLLKKLAKMSTSCGRFGRYGLKQCGRCVPCLIRRSAFKKWKFQDMTEYCFNNLGIKDFDHALFDDVRSSAIAIKNAQGQGFALWLGPALSNPIFDKDRLKYENVIKRGIKELQLLLDKYKIK